MAGVYPRRAQIDHLGVGWVKSLARKHCRPGHGVWQRYEVQPHRIGKFKLSNDPQFEEKVRDIVGLYLNPLDRALVLCVDEKSQIQARDRTAPMLPLRPGLPERQTHDYAKCHSREASCAGLSRCGKPGREATAPRENP